jgi:endonuclease/exonuclease/phosphatase family metal-dependent hydrolase
MITRRIIAVAGTVVLGGAASFAVTIAPAASASSAVLGTPTGVHVASATSTSLTVSLHATANARKYRLYVSSLKSDLYANNITHGSKHEKSATSGRPRIEVAGLKYTTQPYYYRVAVSDGSAFKLSPAYQLTYLRPKTPTSFTATANRTGTYLSWHSKAVTGFVIKQSTDSSFSHNVRTYRTRGPITTFTPYNLSAGETYYFQVRGLNTTRMSAPSPTLATTVDTNESIIRVLAYNSLDASFDGQRHPGGISEPFAKRRAGQLALIKRGNAAVVGIEEGNSCLIHYKHKPCYMQIQSLAHGLSSRYKLDDTTANTGGAAGLEQYSGNYILYQPKLVTPVGAGGHWLIGPEGPLDRFAAYQVFRVNATGARFMFVDTHLLATAGAKGDRIRGAQTESMLKQARAYAARQDLKSVLYLGDFNSYRDEWHVNDLTGKAMLAAGIPDGIDVAQTRFDAKYDSINALYRVARKGHGSSDHIYASPGIGVLSWGELLHIHDGRFVGIIPSDHNPVYSSVAIPY